jgi:cation:H+ antiporter
VDIVLLIAGIAGLLIGTELTISSALAIAKRHHLSEFFVGLVILSIGSDLPEIAIAIDAGIKGSMGIDVSDVVIGSAIGSVIGQIGLVLGITGLLGYLTMPVGFIFRHGAMLLGATVLLYLVAWDGGISRTEGLILITMYVVYIFAVLKGEEPARETTRALVHGGINSWIVLSTGLLVLIGSSELAVRSVVGIAVTFDVSELVISLLVIGLGTSLPELSISVSAILRKKTRLSVGNIIGSTTLDTLVPIGIAAIISPLRFDRGLLLFDLPYIFVMIVIVLVFFVRKKELQKSEAAVILSLYLVYVSVKLHQF